MNDNRAFTLVELLTTIAVLLLIMTIIIPKVVKQLDNSENVVEQDQINTIINISKIYTNQNTSKLPEENQTSVITMQELKQSGLINKSQIINPKTKEEMTGCIKITNEQNKYKYIYGDCE